MQNAVLKKISIIKSHLKIQLIMLFSKTHKKENQRPREIVYTLPSNAKRKSCCSPFVVSTSVVLALTRLSTFSTRLSQLSCWWLVFPPLSEPLWWDPPSSINAISPGKILSNNSLIFLSILLTTLFATCRYSWCTVWKEKKEYEWKSVEIPYFDIIKCVDIIKGSTQDITCLAKNDQI